MLVASIASENFSIFINWREFLHKNKKKFLEFPLFYLPENGQNFWKSPGKKIWDKSRNPVFVSHLHNPKTILRGSLPV